MPARPNYKFDKRQRDLAKKKQQDEKRLKKRARNETKDGAAASVPGDPAAADPPVREDAAGA